MLFRSGSERNIVVELASGARRRYPNADVRYRQTYIAPEGAVQNGPAPETQQQPVVVSGSQWPREPSSGTNEATMEESRPTMRRRPAVNERTGPSGPAASPTASEPAAPTAAPPTPAAEKKGGWRRVEPGDLKP